MRIALLPLHFQSLRCISSLDALSNKLESSRARVHKSIKIYSCILSLLSLELVRVCNRTLTSLSLYIVSWII